MKAYLTLCSIGELNIVLFQHCTFIAINILMQLSNNYCVEYRRGNQLMAQKT